MKTELSRSAIDATFRKQQFQRKQNTTMGREAKHLTPSAQKRKAKAKAKSTVSQWELSVGDATDEPDFGGICHPMTQGRGGKEGR